LEFQVIQVGALWTTDQMVRHRIWLGWIRILWNRVSEKRCSRQDVTLCIYIAQQGREKLCMHEETIYKNHKKACILFSMLASSQYASYI